MYLKVNLNQSKDNPKKLIVDICAFDDARIINELYLNKLRGNIFPSGAGYIRRFQLDLDANTCIEPNANARGPQGHHAYSYAHNLVPVQFELPRLNPRYVAKSYRCMYGVRAPPGRLFDVLLKLDVGPKEQSALREEACTSSSEPIFALKPDAKDDGIVLSIVLDKKNLNDHFYLYLMVLLLKNLFAFIYQYIFLCHFMAIFIDFHFFIIK